MGSLRECRKSSHDATGRTLGQRADDHAGPRAAEFGDLEFEKCQLIDVSFGGSEVENLTIKNSTLKDIDFGKMTVLKTVFKNGILTTESIPIQDYDSFLIEFVKE